MIVTRPGWRSAGPTRIPAFHRFTTHSRHPLRSPRSPSSLAACCDRRTGRYARALLLSSTPHNNNTPRTPSSTARRSARDGTPAGRRNRANLVANGDRILALRRHGHNDGRTRLWVGRQWHDPRLSAGPGSTRPCSTPPLAGSCGFLRPESGPNLPTRFNPVAAFGPHARRRSSPGFGRFRLGQAVIDGSRLPLAHLGIELRAPLDLQRGPVERVIVAILRRQCLLEQCWINKLRSRWARRAESAAPVRQGVATAVARSASQRNPRELQLILIATPLPRRDYPTLNAATAFSSNFKPRPGFSGSTSMPFSIAGVSSYSASIHGMYSTVRPCGIAAIR